jgi:CheY-like chemotaxis protein
MMSIELIRGMVKEPEGRALVDNIGLSAQRGADIVKQVLSFARGLEGQRIEVQIKHLVSDIGGIIAGTFPKNIRFEDCVPFDTWTILGDPTQMHQVLLNLCVNARDAMPGGGVLRIDAVNRTLDEQYCSMYPQATPGKFVVIEVTDTGSGIPQNILDRIFEPFFTTKEVGKGTGLGLSTVFAIVKSHGGFITVRSEPGKGTTFSICFPAESSLVQTDRGDNLNSPPRGNGETILIIDDELSVLAVTRQTLEAFGYQAICASNGAEGIASYAAQRAKIAVVLTDLIMPVMDGIVTAREMKVIDPDVRIIIASGYNTDKQLAEANDLGFRDFLPKPYTARVLLEKLQSILQEPAKRSTGQELP